MNIMKENIIRNTEAERMKNVGKWVFIYGRRKTGKSFYVKNFMKWDEYFFVTREGSIIRNNETLTFQEFFPLFKSLLGEKTIVLDEFHRLPPLFLDYLHSTGAKGRLVVISSTLWLSQKLIANRSPILGLFYSIPFSIIDEKDIICGLSGIVKNKKELVEAAVYLREPILLQHYKPPLRGFLSRYLIDNKMALQGLVGEIFREEDRYLSNVYAGIMQAVASGKVVSTEISSYLFSHGLIQKDNPGLIQRYLETLVSIGIFEKEKVWNKKKFIYTHVSPLLDIYFYANEKYGLSERQVPEIFIKAVINEKLPIHVERFVKSLVSKIYGLPTVKIEEPEIDFALTTFKKISVVGEVKWKCPNAMELRKIEEKLGKFAEEKLLIVPEKIGIESKVLKIFEPWELLKLAQKYTAPIK